MARRLTYSVILCGLALSLCAPAFAQQDVDEQLAESKAKNAELAKKASVLGSEVTNIKTKLVETAASLRQTEDSMSNTDRRLKELHAQERECATRLEKTQQALGGLVMAAQRYRRTSTPDLLLESSPIDAARAALIMKSMIPELDKQSDDLKTQLHEIEEIEQSISQQQSILAQELKQHNDQQVDLKKLLDQRQAVYAQTEAKRKTEAEAVRQLAEKARNLEDLVSKIKTNTKSASSYHLPSNILLPVRGIIRVGFGETDELGGRSKGVTFLARPGAPVVTPLGGKVKFAGPFQKYRQILIIEHRGGYHSLIAGLGRIDTVVGASLDAGEPVGAADTSSSDARVYYELRQNGAPVNPQKLLAEQHKQEKS
jgi:septal ring factor EnvC (AmiA/AmiB activator)